MSKWIAEFELEDGDTMPEHMVLEYKGAKIDFHCKALEQEPCEDCISRHAVLAIAGDSCLDLDSYEDTREFCDEIKELPPVTPQPNTGHWIDEGFYAESHNEHAYRCSECDEQYIGDVGKLDYCPKCRTKMEVNE